MYSYKKKQPPKRLPVIIIPVLTGCLLIYDGLNRACHHPVKSLYELGGFFQLLTFYKHCLLEQKKADVFAKTVVV